MWNIDAYSCCFGINTFKEIIDNKLDNMTNWSSVDPDFMDEMNDNQNNDNIIHFEITKEKFINGFDYCYSIFGNPQEVGEKEHVEFSLTILNDFLIPSIYMLDNKYFCVANKSRYEQIFLHSFYCENYLYFSFIIPNSNLNNEFNIVNSKVYNFLKIQDKDIIEIQDKGTKEITVLRPKNTEKFKNKWESNPVGQLAVRRNIIAWLLYKGATTITSSFENYEKKAIGKVYEISFINEGVTKKILFASDQHNNQNFKEYIESIIKNSKNVE